MKKLGLISLAAFLGLFGAASAEAAAAFTIDNNSLSFTGTVGSSPGSQTVGLSNKTQSALNLSINSTTTSGGAWLSASASPNPVPGNGSSTITVSINSAKLPNGHYNGTVTISGGGTTATISVGLDVVGVVSIAVSPNIVNLSLGGGQTVQKPVSITGGPANVAATVATQDGGSWITIGGFSGTAPGSLSVVVNTTGLSSGTHNGTVTVQCVNGSNCTSVPISVSVTVSNLMLDVTSMAFTANAGSAPLSKTATLTNATPNSIQISIASTTQGGGVWLSASASSTLVGGSGSTSIITVSVDPSALPPSPTPYQGTVTITGGGFTLQIAVSATVNGVTISVTPSSLSFTAAAGAKAPSKSIQVTNPGANSLVTITTANGGVWLTATPSGAQGAFDIVADAAKLSSGVTYAGDLAVSCDTSKGPACATQHVAVTFAVTGPAPGQPAIAPGGVITAGAFGGASSIGPGTYIEIYGSNLASTTREWAAGDFIGLNAPMMLDNVSLKINGQPAFIRFVSPNQVNALAPDNLGTGQAQMILTTSAGASAPYTVNVSPLQPGLLAPPVLKLNGLQYIVGICGDGSYVLPAGNPIPGLLSRPAKPDETIVFYGIGFGLVSPSVSTGVISLGLTNLQSPLQVFFGSTQATVSYKGLGPGFVGLYQFNVVVPSVPDNDAVPITFTLNGANLAQKLYIAVHR
jgi:uncharacterized protein (TIGR03437 family)